MSQPWLHRTTWALTGIPGNAQLKLTLTVDTSAKSVVQAIELAAARNGVKLERQGDKTGPWVKAREQEWEGEA
jgi:hypothetical protein